MTIEKLKPYKENLISVEMRKESTNNLIYKATTDRTFNDGLFSDLR